MTIFQACTHGALSVSDQAGLEIKTSGRTLTTRAQFLTINSSSVWIHQLLLAAGSLCPALQSKWSHFLSRHAVLCAICWVKRTGPLLESRDSACLERNKSLLAVARVALRHYSVKRGMALMVTNTGEQGSFTTHPLSIVPILQWLLGHLSPSQGYICIPELLILRDSHILVTQKRTTHMDARRVLHSPFTAGVKWQ